jgi:hypothetical protein
VWRPARRGRSAGGNAQRLASAIGDWLNEPQFQDIREKVQPIVAKHKRDPRLPWIVADLRPGNRNIGREILSNTGGAIEWPGRLDFRDKAAMARFRKFIK